MDKIKVSQLMERVYNNKMIEDKEKNIFDEKDMKELCSKVFGDGSVTPNPAMVHDFNNIAVQLADQIAKPMITDMLNLFADFKTASMGTIYQYTIPAKSKVRLKWSALGTGADAVRVEGGKKTLVTPANFQAAVYYEPLDMVQDSVTNFRNLINNIAEAKAKLYLKEIMKLIDKAVTSGKIPTPNIKSGSNLTFGDYSKVASTISRVGNGGKAIFVADSLLIDYFANFQASDNTLSRLLTDNIKAELLTALVPTTIGRTTAINLVNPFIDDTNSKAELPVNVGYMFSSAVSAKPFVVVEYSGLRQMTEQDAEDERIKVVLKQEAGIDLIYGEAIGMIKEDSAVKLV